MTKLFQKESLYCFQNQLERQGATSRSQEVKGKRSGGLDMVTGLEVAIFGR